MEMLLKVEAANAMSLKDRGSERSGDIATSLPAFQLPKPDKRLLRPCCSLESYSDTHPCTEKVGLLQEAVQRKK